MWHINGKDVYLWKEGFAPLGSLKLSAPSAQGWGVASKPCFWFVPFHGALSSFKYP